MNHQQVMTEYLLSFIEGLKQAGVCQAVISPGSRSTPLALLLHREKTVTCHIDVDERSAAFFALGLAKASQTAVVLLCTSGTAAANFYPAICEAYESAVPLIVLTTDRPPELHHVGAAQTMSQNHLYADHVKLSYQMALPENTPNLLRYSYWQAYQLALTAQQLPFGPVHANFPLREPLLPDLALRLSEEQRQTMQTQYIPLPKLVLANQQPTALLPEELQCLLQAKGIIVVGGECTLNQAKALHQLSQHLSWPIIGDPLTQLAATGKDNPLYLKQAEIIFQKVQDLPTPQVVLRFGKLPVTKNVMLYLQSLTQQAIPQILVDETQRWPDPLHICKYLLPWSILDFVQVAKAVRPSSAPVISSALSAWAAFWQKRQQIAQQVVALQLAKQDFDDSIASVALADFIAEDEVLFVANSNAIRLVDRLAPSLQQGFQTFGNRGVNGIDGIISTVAGLASAKRQRVYLLVGDLTLFHDMNGLQMIQKYQLPVTIVLLNNNSGGIFSFLSQRQLSPSDFDPLFATALDISFEKVAQLYQMSYVQPTTKSAFIAALANSRQQSTASLIEVKSTAELPVALWQRVLAAYQQSILEEKEAKHENNYS